MTTSTSRFDDHSALFSERDEVRQMIAETQECWGTWAKLDLIDNTVAEMEAEGLVGESNLEKVAKGFRQLLLERADSIHQRAFRSPIVGRAPVLPTGHRINEGYERNSGLDSIEERIAQYGPRRKGWRVEGFLASSGMAVIFHLMWAMASVSGRQLSVKCVADYFETGHLMRAASSLGFNMCADGEADILIIEPVSYNNTVTDEIMMEHLRSFADQKDSAHRLVIFDVTLDPSSENYDHWLKCLEQTSSLVTVAFVRSALKFDQAGLELMNAGVAEVLTCGERATDNRLLQAARINRSLVGSSLPFSAQATATLPFVLTRTRTETYAKKVLSNNAAFRDTLLQSTGQFIRCEEGNGPFVTFSLLDSDLTDHMLMMAALRLECRQLGLAVEFGSSFGFRHSRFEGIIPDPSHPVWGQPILKVAVGARRGPSIPIFRDLIAEIDSLGSAGGLRRQYKSLLEKSQHRAKIWTETEKGRGMPSWMGAITSDAWK